MNILKNGLVKEVAEEARVFLTESKKDLEIGVGIVDELSTALNFILPQSTAQDANKD